MIDSDRNKTKIKSKNIQKNTKMICIIDILPHFSQNTLIFLYVKSLHYKVINFNFNLAK